MTADELLARVDERTEAILKTCEEHTSLLRSMNGRVKELELWKGRILGFMACATVISPMFIFEVRQAIGEYLGGG